MSVFVTHHKPNDGTAVDKLIKADEFIDSLYEKYKNDCYMNISVHRNFHVTLIDVYDEAECRAVESFIFPGVKSQDKGDEVAYIANQIEHMISVDPEPPAVV